MLLSSLLRIAWVEVIQSLLGGNTALPESLSLPLSFQGWGTSNKVEGDPHVSQGKCTDS